MKKNAKFNDEAQRNDSAARRNDILVSIILSESTSSLLHLDVPNIEDCCSDVDQTTCIIRPVTKNQLNQTQASLFSYLFGMGNDMRKETNEISPELAFFSDHFNSESSSECDISDQYDAEWLEGEEPILFDEDAVLPPMCRNLNPMRVFVKPLLNAKTTAHDDNIAIEDNDIIVKLFDEENSSCSVSSELMCRICHGGESAGDLLKPCRCRGTIALAHIECLEHWLRESANSYCELCKHHFRIVRQPKYGLLWSIFVYLSSPGENFRDVILDLLAFIFYTPSAIATTYMLMVICENMAKAHLNRTRNMSAHLVAFCAIFGMAAIDFTYSSWLILTFQRHVMAWRVWYRNNSYLRLLLPEHRRKAYTTTTKSKLKLQSIDIVNQNSHAHNASNVAGSVSA